MISRRSVLIAFGAVALAAPVAAVGDGTVTIVPPAGPTWHGPCPTGGGECDRTADRQPQFGVEANDVPSGDQLRCSFDSAAPGQCGPALPGCTAQVCASAQPGTPLSYGDHTVDVTVVDPDGFSAGGGQDLAFEVADPPHIKLTPGFRGSPWAPNFILDAEGANGYASAQCSLTAVGAPAQWQDCERKTQQEYTEHVPHRRADYSFQARAIDDFGRTAVAQPINFNPVPCVSQARPATLAGVIAGGLAVRSNCSFVPGMYVSLFLAPYVGGGQRPLAVKVVRGPAVSRWKASLRLRPSRAAAAYLRTRRSVRVVLFSDPAGHCRLGCTYSSRKLTLGP